MPCLHYSEYRTRPNTYSYRLIDFIAGYVLETDQISQEEVDAWSDELKAFGQSGAYFFSNNRYIFTLTK